MSQMWQARTIEETDTNEVGMTFDLEGRNIGIRQVGSLSTGCSKFTRNFITAHEGLSRVQHFSFRKRGLEQKD